MFKVLVTGASGFIGRLICPHLQSHGFAVSCFDRSPGPVVADTSCGCLEDLETVRAAARGVDAIIHLAGCADEADFVTCLVPSNVIGIHNVLEAARLEGVQRLIFASSCQTANLLGCREAISVEDRFPTNLYGLTKLWAEDMARMYSRLHGLSVLVARLGWVVRTQAELDEMVFTPTGGALFLSHRDTRRFFLCCLLAKPAAFAVVYAFSKQYRPVFDMAPAKTLLGFEPNDRFLEGLDPGFCIPRCNKPL